MQAWIQTNEDGYIVASTTHEEFSEGMTETELPDDFDFDAQNEYRFADGELAHDPPEPSEEELEAREEAERQSQIRAAVPMLAQTMAASLTDAQLLAVPLLFDEWAADTDYRADEVLRHGGELYRVAQDHTSQAQWEPGATGTESLYTHITVDPETGYDVWQRPTGAHDAYDTGDRVLYPDADGKVYESTIDGNTWSPEEYPQGWREVSE